MLEIKSLRSKKFENMRKHCISECKLCIHIYVILILSMHIYANTALTQMLKITFNGPCLSSLIKISVKISLYSKVCCYNVPYLGNAVKVNGNSSCPNSFLTSSRLEKCHISLFSKNGIT